MSFISTLIALLIINFSALGLLHSALSALLKTKQAYYRSYAVVQNQSGFTLISLMLNLLLTSLTTIAIISVFVALKNIYSEQLAWARLQENARAAFVLFETNKRIPMPFQLRNKTLFLKRGERSVAVISDVANLTFNYSGNFIQGEIAFMGPKQASYAWPIQLRLSDG